MPEDMAALLPPGTTGLVYVHAPEALESKLVALAEMVAPEKAASVTITAMMRGNLGPLAAYWDPSRPVAVAAVPTPLGGGSMMPAITVLVPVTDPEQAMSDLGVDPDTPNPMLAFEGDYAALTMVPGPGGAMDPSTLGDAEFRGDLTIRLDMPMLMANYGPFVNMMFAQMTMGMAAAADSAGPDAETAMAVVNEMGEKLLEVLEAGERTDLVVAIDGGEVEVGYEYAARKGSALDRPNVAPDAVADIAGLLPTEGTWLTSVFDPASVTWMTDGLAEEFEGSAETTPLATAMREVKAFYGALGPAAGVTMGLSRDGMRGGMVAETRGRDEAERAFQRLMEASAGVYDEHGIHIESTSTSTLSGVEVTTVRCRFDADAILTRNDDGSLTEKEKAEFRKILAAFLGEDGTLEVHSGFVDDRLVIGFGSTDEMTRTIDRVRSGGGATPAGIRRVIDRIGLPASFVGVLDLRRVFREVVTVIAEVEGEPGIALAEGAPIEVAFWCGHDGPTYRGGVAADAIGIAEIFDAMPEKDETADEPPSDGMQ